MGGIFPLVCVDGVTNRMLMATGVLEARIQSIKLARLGPRQQTCLLPAWRIEHAQLTKVIARASALIPDLSGIIADYVGSRHEAALDAIWTAPAKHIADCIMVEHRHRHISTRNLIGSLGATIGYPSSERVRRRGGTSASGRIVAGINACRLSHEDGAAWMLNQLYHLLFITWPAKGVEM